MNFWQKTLDLVIISLVFNTLKLKQNGHHFPDECIFLNENVRISIKISLKFVKFLNNNIPALVQIMAWCWPGDKPLSESMMAILLTQICITQPQRVKPQSALSLSSCPVAKCDLKNGQTTQTFTTTGPTGLRISVAKVHVRSSHVMQPCG